MFLANEPAILLKSISFGAEPMLSVVVPAYNEAPTIGRQLIEVASAIPAVSKEIIIVDDCSSDGTSEWLRRNLDHAEGVGRTATLTCEGEHGGKIIRRQSGPGGGS